MEVGVTASSTYTDWVGSRSDTANREIGRKADIFERKELHMPTCVCLDFQRVTGAHSLQTWSKASCWSSGLIPCNFLSQGRGCVLFLHLSLVLCQLKTKEYLRIYNTSIRHENTKITYLTSIFTPLKPMHQTSHARSSHWFRWASALPVPHLVLMTTGID